MFFFNWGGGEKDLVRFKNIVVVIIIFEFK